MTRPEHTGFLIHRSLIALLALAAALAVMRPAAAQLYDPKNGEPPPGQHQHFTSAVWTVKPTPDGGKIEGTVTLDCYLDQKDELILRLKGLQHGQTYSVWLLRKEGDSVERSGVPQAWEGPKAKEFRFKAMPNGVGFFRGCLTACPLGFWKSVEVRYHPDGNGADLQTSVVVIKQKLRSD